MEANEYQKLAARTLIDKPGFEISDRDLMAVWDAIGLAGEAGEVADLIKKGVFHQHGIDLQKLKNELGDTLWYVAALCTTLDLDMSEIMQSNIEKLKTRYPNGYNSDDSKRRVDLIVIYDGEDACQQCLGWKRVDDSEGASWKHWAGLPGQSAIVVQMGLIKPIECPRCHGTGVEPAAI
jgi:NTP pyrophosphatase (non-canonical NTP hydrolase)